MASTKKRIKSVSLNKNVVKITKSFVDKALPHPEKDQTFYRDKLLKGFALRVTSNGVKSFVVEKIICNKVRRITLGKYNEALPVEKARKKAQVLLGQIADGKDPIAEKRVEVMHQTTLDEVMKDYLKARKSLKPKTLYDYERIMRTALIDWRDKPITQITKDKIEAHHTKLGTENGKAYANLTMRVLRALFNFAAGKYEDAEGRSLIADNPVKRLSQTRAWYRVDRRQTFIKAHQLKDWYKGIQQLNNDLFRDYLLLIIFTGLRRQEAAKLTWHQIDFKARTLTITDTKNHDTHTLPLSSYIYELLSHRKKNATSIFVFPAPSASGYIIEPRKQIAKVRDCSGLTFTTHDLRRPFITVAESLDIPAYALKRLLNHKMQNDVTAGYIVTDVERLRKPMQKITDFLQRKMGMRPPVITSKKHALTNEQASAII